MTTPTTVPTNGLESKLSQMQIKPKDTINASKNENDDRKLFVGNLSWETTIEELKEYFKIYGEIKDATIKVDVLGRSRGFGFILFEDNKSVEKALAEQNHILNERKIEPKRATAKEKVKKIFVGGVSPDLPEEDIRKHFEQCGEIEEIAFPINKERKVRKGFCFVTFKDASSCETATARGMEKQELGGKKVDVKKAVPQEVYQEWNMLYQPYIPNYPPPVRGRGGRGMYMNRGGNRGFIRGGRGGYSGGFPPPMYEGYGYDYSLDYYDGYGYQGYPEYGTQGGYGGYGYSLPNGSNRGSTTPRGGSRGARGTR